MAPSAARRRPPCYPVAFAMTTKKTRATRQQQARRRPPQPRPSTPGGALPGAPSGGIGGAGAPVDQDAAVNGGAGTEETAAPAARPATPPAGARRVGRVDPAATRKLRPQQKQQSTFAPLDPEDPAIPFDRVPYVPADLRRVAIMAGFMVLLILIAAVVVTHTVG
jgi:hypothetical protein